MPRRTALVVAAMLLVVVAGCQRAQPYPPAVKLPAKLIDEAPAELDHRWRWHEPDPRRDVPLQFVTDASPEWARLPAFLTHYPPIPPYFGQMPLEASIGLVVTDQIQAIKIKVPRGLPDPAPNFPRNNLPTLGKWQLGRELFHLPALKVGADWYSCASCHNPARGFSDGRPLARDGQRHTLSLINVAYNRRQFWDGRVETLEETLVKSLDDERKLGEKEHVKAVEQHVFGGLVRAMMEPPDRAYHAKFALAFGVRHPTQDTVARALATYLRTILAGDSLYDRAQAARGGKSLSAEHFAGALTADDVEQLTAPMVKRPAREALPALLLKGHALFHGKTRCSECHPAPLFTDHDYHNVGYTKRQGADRDEGWPPPGVDTGRALYVPIGLKETRLIGAFRTPTLRNLGTTAPYFHNGSMPTLARVVEFFDDEMSDTSHLAAVLKDGQRPAPFELTPDEKDALVLFLRSLDGGPVDPVVHGAKK